VAPLIVQDKRKWNSSVFCHMPVPFEPGPAPFPTGASGPTGPVTRSPPQVRTAAINHEASSQTLFRRPLHPVFCWPPQGFICAVFIDWRKPIFRLDPGIALMWPVSECPLRKNQRCELPTLPLIARLRGFHTDTVLKSLMHSALLEYGIKVSAKKCKRRFSKNKIIRKFSKKG
jgi:hypothetical protein